VLSSVKFAIQFEIDLTFVDCGWGAKRPMEGQFAPPGPPGPPTSTKRKSILKLMKIKNMVDLAFYREVSVDRNTATETQTLI
jgi:hypothetical protein